MSEEAKQKAQNLKQSVLDRIDAARKAVVEFSEEELESLVGGKQNPALVSHTTGSSDDPSMKNPLLGSNISPSLIRSNNTSR